ncbi:MAG: M48 family metallopeptidase [Bacteroidota bacterium]
MAGSVEPPVTVRRNSHEKAKRYNRIRITLSLLETIFLFSFVVIIVLSGLSRIVAELALGVTDNTYLALLMFAAAFGLLEIVGLLPLAFYSGFILEHKYDLSNQSVGRWVWEKGKSVLVSIPIVVPILLVFYFFLRELGNLWWLPVSVIVLLFSVVLARLAPTLIFPLFYKFTPLEEGSLRERILHLCTDGGLRVEGVFSFNMSKNTKKANAGFTGVGKSKRIILSDTLLTNFSEEEIETVFAHELGHYKRGHIWKGILTGMVSTFAGLFLTAQLYGASLSWFGFTRVDDLAALPVLSIWLGIYGLVTSPLNNALSRRFEREADQFALGKTNNPDAFISTMKKLAEQNLADVSPHPIVEFLFYSHPSIEKRVRFAESFEQR